MKPMNVLKRYGAKLAAAGTSIALVPLAMAQTAPTLAEQATTALGELKVDVTTVCAGVFAVVLVLVAFRFFKRAT